VSARRRAEFHRLSTSLASRSLRRWFSRFWFARVLSVTFPDSIDTHSQTQLYYFDDAGLLRRVDYQPVVNAQRPVANYIRDEGTFDGIVVPTKRHIHARNEDRTPDLSGTSITLDLSDIRFS
jgi:hypothetical protein